MKERTAPSATQAASTSRCFGPVAVAFVLLPALVAVGAYRPHTFLERDASFYALMAHGLVRHHTLDARVVQPASWYDGRNPAYRDVDQAWSNVSVGREGRWWPKHSFLMPVLAAPLYAAMGPDGLLLFNVLVAAALLVTVLWLGSRCASWGAAAGATALFATSPEFLEHVYFFSHDLFAALLCVAAIAALLRGRAALAGFLAGMALWARPPVLLVVAPMLAWAWRARADVRPGAGRRLAAGAALPLLAAAVANAWMFGRPWTTAYDRILVVRHGVQAVESVRAAFDLPWGQGLRRLLFDDVHGIVRRMPVLLVALGAVPIAWRRATDGAARCGILAAAVALVATVAAWVPYRYSDVRFLFPALACAVLPLAKALDALGAWPRRNAASVAPPRGSRRPSRCQRRTIAALAGAAVTLVALGTWLPLRRAGKPWRLSEHVADVAVWLGRIPCDYFNLRHEAWECSRVEPHAWQWLGVDLAGRCRFGERTRRAVWAHPNPNGEVKRIVVPGVPGGQTLRLELGVAPTGRGPACVEVRYAGRDVRRICVERPGAWHAHAMRLQPRAGPATLEIVLPSQPAGARHLCLDAALPRPPTKERNHPK